MAAMGRVLPPEIAVATLDTLVARRLIKLTPGPSAVADCVSAERGQVPSRVRSGNCEGLHECTGAVTGGNFSVPVAHGVLLSIVCKAPRQAADDPSGPAAPRTQR